MKKHPSTLQDWLDWQQTLHPKNIDFKLERNKSVYNRLNIDSLVSTFPFNINFLMDFKNFFPPQGNSPVKVDVIIL